MILTLLLSAYSARGVYYPETVTKCPVGCLRVALDDNDSAVEVQDHHIVWHHTKKLGKKQIVGDVLLLGKSANGPVAVHVLVKKHGDKLSGDLHAHAVSEGKIKDIVLEDFDLVLDDGKKKVTVMAKDSARKAIEDPSLAAKLVSELVEVKKNAPHDVTVGLGVGKASKDVARVAVSSSFDKPDWQVKITALSHLIPQEVIARDLFLFALESVSLLDGVRQKGFTKGQTLTLAENKVMLDGKEEALPSARSSAMAFLEFSFIGTIAAHAE